jgi:hypothetical protein
VAAALARLFLDWGSVLNRIVIISAVFFAQQRERNAFLQSVAVDRRATESSRQRLS